MVKMQGGVFGAVARSTDLLRGVAPEGPLLRNRTENGALGLEASRHDQALRRADRPGRRNDAGFTPAAFMPCWGRTGPARARWSSASWATTAPIQGQVAVGELRARDRPTRACPCAGRRHGLPALHAGPGMTVAENLVLSRTRVPAVVKWADEMLALESFMDGMPFRVPLDVPVSPWPPARSRSWRSSSSFT